MERRKYLKTRSWLYVGVLLLLLISSVHAEGISVTPSTLNITSTVSMIEPRTLAITARQNVTDLAIIPLDLSAGDGRGIIPQQSFHISPYSASMTNGSIQQVPLNIDLSSVKSGSYSGELWVAYSNGGVAKIPVMATVKDGLLWPFVCLVLGAGISYLLFTYQTKFKAADEIRITLGVIIKNINSDEDLKKRYWYDNTGHPDTKVQNPFDKTIRDAIRTSESNLELKAIPDAEKHMKIAQGAWDTWNTNRPRLTALLDQCSDLISAMNDFEKKVRDKTSKDAVISIPLITSLRENLQKKFDALVTDTGQKEMEDAVKKTQDQCKTFNLAVNNLEVIESICEQTGTQCPACNELAAAWLSLKEIRDQPALEKASKDIEKLRTTAETFQSKLTKSITGLMMERSDVFHLQLFTPGNIPDAYIVNEGILAKFRLLLYNSGLFLITVGTLIAFGLMEFYVPNPTFGASMNDYLALIIWGFMAGATADTIATKMKGKVGIS